ncbi:hypothetical protein F2P81_000886 [Scophthalmus maximus]|uniref:Uncharacterized protein n=1 Tax=Scophthalmus maximus TaxID=52904 RepID=A0A6A4TM82_SCOMX|nr:hypothetical protein F2P81_000886 [Scophthalmus maximus]
MQSRRLGDVGLQLRTLCHQTLGSWDYLFFVAIGFVIFAAGTVSAWVMGVIMVLYERYIKKKDEQLDPDDEDDASEAGRASRARSDHDELKCVHTCTAQECTMPLVCVTELLQPRVCQSVLRQCEVLYRRDHSPSPSPSTIVTETAVKAFVLRMISRPCRMASRRDGVII